MPGGAVSATRGRCRAGSSSRSSVPSACSTCRPQPWTTASSWASACALASSGSRTLAVLHGAYLPSDPGEREVDVSAPRGVSTRLSGPVIGCHDASALSDFYAAVLGWKVVDRYEDKWALVK